LILTAAVAPGLAHPFTGVRAGDGEIADPA
jgi:hypothetical protein